MEQKKRTGGPCRVVLADSQHKVRFALRVMLDRRPDFRVVGEAVDSAELLTLVSHIQPDLVLASWGSLGLEEDDLPQRVIEAAPDAYLVVLSEKPGLGPAALSAGARAFVYKGNPPEELLTALDQCLETREV